jgi:acyl transferase domain-containing protein
VAYFLGTHGPTVTLETACSSSLVALSMAVSALQTGECDLAILVGNNSLGGRDFHLSLQACGVLVAGPSSHPFDQDAPKGYLRCEGTGAVVLKRMPEAVASGDRILCEIMAAIAGSAGSAEGATEGAGRVYEQPCAKGMKEMFKRATRLNGISAVDVDYMGKCYLSFTRAG